MGFAQLSMMHLCRAMLSVEVPFAARNTKRSEQRVWDDYVFCPDMINGLLVKWSSPDHQCYICLVLSVNLPLMLATWSKQTTSNVFVHFPARLMVPLVDVVCGYPSCKLDQHWEESWGVVWCHQWECKIMLLLQLVACFKVWDPMWIKITKKQIKSLCRI